MSTYRNLPPHIHKGQPYTPFVIADPAQSLRRRSYFPWTTALDKNNPFHLDFSKLLAKVSSFLLHFNPPCQRFWTKICIFSSHLSEFTQSCQLLRPSCQNWSLPVKNLTCPVRVWPALSHFNPPCQAWKAFFRINNACRLRIFSPLSVIWKKANSIEESVNFNLASRLSWKQPRRFLECLSQNDKLEDKQSFTE